MCNRIGTGTQGIFLLRIVLQFHKQQIFFVKHRFLISQATDFFCCASFVIINPRPLSLQCIITCSAGLCGNLRVLNGYFFITTGKGLTAEAARLPAGRQGRRKERREEFYCQKKWPRPPALWNPWHFGTRNTGTSEHTRIFRQISPCSSMFSVSPWFSSSHIVLTRNNYFSPLCPHPFSYL